MYEQNTYENMYKWCKIGLESLEDLKIHKIIVDESNTYHSDTPFNYKIYFKVDGYSYGMEYEDKETGEYVLPELKQEWIHIDFTIDSWERNPVDVFKLIQNHKELLEMDIGFMNSDIGRHADLGNVNQGYSDFIMESMNDHAQTIYEYEHDL